MVDVKRDIRLFQMSCRQHGVEIARPFPPLLTHARITIGTMSEMERAALAFRSALAEPPPTTAVLAPIPPHRPRGNGTWAC
jgi:hypothetical protein